MTAPIAIELLEDAFAAWVTVSTGATPYFVEPESSGAPTPPTPSAQISWSDPVLVSRPQIEKIPSIMVQRYTVTTGGAGTVGVNFSLGFSPTSTPITITSGALDTPTTSAALLLVEITAELPSGVTAATDPEDPASILVTGSTSEPMHVASSFNSGTLETPLFMQTVTPVVERYPELEAEWSSMTWRTSWRSSETRGFGTAGDLLIRARKDMNRKLLPACRAAGWQYAGILATMTPSPTRGDSASLATLDLSLEGWATAAYQSPAMRLAGFEINATP